MWNQKFLAVTIILALGASQLAATMHAVGHLHGQMHGPEHGQIHGQMHGQMHGQVHGQVHHDQDGHSTVEFFLSKHSQALHSKSNASLFSADVPATVSIDALIEQCMLFHLYLAQQACGFVPQSFTEFSVSKSEIRISRTAGTTVPGADLIHIRGPPVSV